MIEEIKKYIEILLGNNPDTVLEIRVLGDCVKKCKIFKVSEVEKIVDFIKAFNGKCNIYTTINPVKPELYTCTKSATIKDILNRVNLFIDFDPVREVGIEVTKEERKAAKKKSSTNEEKKMALDKLNEVKKYLEFQGWEEPTICDSGNGYHLMYSIDLENTEENTQLIKGLLYKLDNQFSDEYVKIDKSVHDACRITKLYGTIAVKGSNTHERPHRQSEIISSPIVRKIVTLEQIKELVGEKEESPKDGVKSTAWIEAFISKHGIDVLEKVKYEGGYKYILPECPFFSEHEKDSAIVIRANGKLGFHCFHDGCADNGWKEFRALYEPYDFIKTTGDIKEIERVVDKLKFLEPHLKYPPTDKGFGELFADVFKDVLRYNATAKEWYYYDGKVWIRDCSLMRGKSRAKTLLDALHIYSDRMGCEKDYLKEVLKLHNLTKREKMLKDAQDKYFISASDLDSNTDLFNCQNGTFNLKTSEFGAHNGDDLLSKISNVYFDPLAISYDWTNFISEIMKCDAEKTSYLQKVLGYALTTDTHLETCFMLYGPKTRNGKSTLVETIASLLGNTAGYALTMSSQTLAQKKNNDSRQASGDIARLSGCRFLNVSEPPKRMIFDTALFKTLIGRDSITARHLNQSEFEFIPHFKLFINTNFLPIITDDSVFTSGRINVITFEQHFPIKEQDNGLKDRLKELHNISGIFNWLLEGLKKFREEGAVPPTSIEMDTSDYRSNSDKMGNFILECLEKSNGNSKAAEVYNSYRNWCSENGYGCENKGNFFDELKSKNLYGKSATVNNKTCRNIVKGYRIVESTNFLPHGSNSLV